MDKEKGRDSQEGEQPAPPPKKKPEIWITYPIISTVERRFLGGYGAKTDRSGKPLGEPPVGEVLSGEATPTRRLALSIRLRCRDFTFFTFCFEKEKDAKDAYESIRLLTCSSEFSFVNELYLLAKQLNSLRFHRKAIRVRLQTAKTGVQSQHLGNVRSTQRIHPTRCFQELAVIKD